MYNNIEISTFIKITRLILGAYLLRVFLEESIDDEDRGYKY